MTISQNRFHGGFFKILKKDKRTKARLGVLSTPHGKIITPSYVFVGTYGKFRHLTPRDIKRTKTQLVIANTFHLWDPVLKYKGGTSKASRKTFLTKSFGLNIPTMTDSGGFQVFSLGFGKNRVGKILTTLNVVSPQVMHKRKNIKITDQGVYFSMDGGRKRFLGPALSVKIQEKLGADIIFAFDECTSPLDDFKYNKEALERTHRWAKKSLKAKTRKDQMLFGIVQGGRFKSLRVQSAKFISSLPFEGIGIGGSFGKNEMVKTLKWVVPHLPKEKPRHLLGVGRVEDVFNAVEQGIDIFDCVIPTREARHGRLYTKTGHMDIRKGKYIIDREVIEKGCGCQTCSKKIPRSKIRELIKSDNKNLNAKGQRYCLMHNMWFFNNLLEEIRRSIQRGNFTEFKKKFLRNYPTKVPFVGVKNVL